MSYEIPSFLFKIFISSYKRSIPAHSPNFPCITFNIPVSGRRYYQKQELDRKLLKRFSFSPLLIGSPQSDTKETWTGWIMECFHALVLEFSSMVKIPGIPVGQTHMDLCACKVSSVNRYAYSRTCPCPCALSSLNEDKFFSG